MNLLQNKELFRQIFLFSPQPSVITSAEGELLYANKAAERLLGYTQNELLIMDRYMRIFVEPDAPADLLNRTKQYGYIENIPVKYRIKSKEVVEVLYSARFVELGTEKYIIATIQAPGQHKEADNIEQYSHAILEMLTSNSSLTQVLTKIAYFIEDELKDSLASIMVLDEKEQKLRLGAAPSLPDSYNEAIDGMDIGPSVGACGTAAYTGERVITENLLTHPYWAKFTNLVKKNGLRSCWSEPIKNSQGKILGTFAVYHKEPKAPTQKEIEVISAISQLAMIAIEYSQVQEELHYNKKQYELITQNSTDIIWTLGPSGRFTYVSPSSQTILGYTPQEMAGKKFADVVLLKYAKMLDQSRNKIMEVVSSGIPVTEEMKTKPPFKETIEVEQIKKDGSTLWTEINFNTVFDPGNRFINIVGITRDISKRKEMEEKLRKSEELFSTVVYTSPDGIGVGDSDMKVNYVSDTLLHMYKYDSLDEVKGKSLFEFFAPEYREKAGQEFKNLFAGEYRGPHEYKVLRKDGTTFWAEISSQIIQNKENGSFEGLFFITRDISQRKETEERLRESEELFSTIVYTSPDGIGMSDMSGAVTYVSEKLLHIIGYDRFEEVQGKSILDLFAPEYKDKVAKKISDLFKGIPATPDEYIFHKKDGTPIWLEISIQVLQGFDKIPVGTFFIARDVSDRKETEAKLQEYTEKLKELNAIKDRYFSIIAHDLRNPFTALRGITAIMQNKLENKQYDELEEYVKMLDTATERTHELLENLLEWSLIQIEDGISFAPKKLQLAKLIYNITLLQANSLESNKINLNIDVDENIYLQADRNMVETILRNLLSNAMKFTPDGGNISIAAELLAPNNMIKISVADSGMGIKPDNINKLFRIETNYSTYGARHEKGTGLGLILCREFVERHGGRIWVDSEEGKGSTFNLTLPVAK